MLEATKKELNELIKELENLATINLSGNVDTQVNARLMAVKWLKRAIQNSDIKKLDLSDIDS